VPPTPPEPPPPPKPPVPPTPEPPAFEPPVPEPLPLGFFFSSFFFFFFFLSLLVSLPLLFAESSSARSSSGDFDPLPVFGSLGSSLSFRVGVKVFRLLLCACPSRETDSPTATTATTPSHHTRDFGETITSPLKTRVNLHRVERRSGNFNK
jgi:hypothetical protein